VRAKVPALVMEERAPQVSAEFQLSQWFRRSEWPHGYTTSGHTAHGCRRLRSGSCMPGSGSARAILSLLVAF